MLWPLLRVWRPRSLTLLQCAVVPTCPAMSKSSKRGCEEAGIRAEAGTPAKRPAAAAASGHWANGLLAAMEDPDLRVFADSQIVVIKDKYPKAQFHFLVMPRQSIPSLKAVNKSHLELLQHMHKVACDIAQLKEHKSKNFKMGYHAEPSMHHLHMHLISDDFCSDCLKTKKHYNSFTTDHFIESQKLIDSVVKTGKIVTLSTAESHKLLQRPLKCHKCGESMTNMPKLKTHLSLHADAGNS